MNEAELTSGGWTAMWSRKELFWLRPSYASEPPAKSTNLLQMHKGAQPSQQNPQPEPKLLTHGIMR